MIRIKNTILALIGFSPVMAACNNNEVVVNDNSDIVTGDIKFHTALDSPIVIFDIGHFESEILVLQVFEKLLPDVETIRADEKSPFIY